MIKYTVTDLVTKQQSNKQKNAYSLLLKCIKYIISVKVSIFHHDILKFIDILKLTIYVYIYTCIHAFIQVIYIPYSIHDIKPIKAKEGSRGGRSPFYRCTGKCRATMERGAVNAATLVLSKRS